MKTPTKTHFGNRGDFHDGEPLPPASFPFADSEWLADAPPQCRHCGGCWRIVDEGYCCRQCGRRWRAAECLREMVGRVMEQSERWPRVRIVPGARRPG